MKILLVVLMLSDVAFAQAPARQGYLSELFAGPARGRTPWIDSLDAWRIHCKDSLHYDGRAYDTPSWVRRNFIFVLVMAQDRFLYNPLSGRYTVGRYLDDLRRRYGGIDAVLIWPQYPNIGIDDRNQFDWLAGMPGGLPGVKEMVGDFHRRGVKVFFPVMIWDEGTRPYDGSLPAAFIKELKAIGADGMNGDTMGGVPQAWRAAGDSLRYPVVLQPEWAIGDLKMIEWNLNSWGYYWTGDNMRSAWYPYMPGVSVSKWLEPRHQVNVSNRWATDRTDDLQYAFFNGQGYNTWENVWGIFNGVTPRDGEAIRRIASIYRRYPDAWSSLDWQPHIPVLQHGIFASAFPSKRYTLYTFVNRDSADRSGRQLRLPYVPGLHYFDLWNNTALRPSRYKDSVVLEFTIEGRGYGAVLATSGEVPAVGAAPRSLGSFSSTWTPLPQTIVRTGTTPRVVQPPPGMVRIPAAKRYAFVSEGVMLEGGDLPAANGIQHPWQTQPAKSLTHTMDIPSFYIDVYPVTNAQFQRFMEATHYHPRDSHNFLKDWRGGHYPDGWADKPVTWVSIEDARAYATWAHKRLPHEWEWTYAAQGTDGRAYPWGNDRDSTKVPATDRGRRISPPYAVTAFPGGASPFGVRDLVGNVWQWTDEYRDAHTRAAVLKGGSRYLPKGDYYKGQSPTGWYFPPVTDVLHYGRYLLLSPGEDRSATVGFRCVKDR